VPERKAKGAKKGKTNQFLRGREECIGALPQPQNPPLHARKPAMLLFTPVFILVVGESRRRLLRLENLGNAGCEDVD
jgi:hypothetical protein